MKEVLFVCCSEVSQTMAPLVVLLLLLESSQRVELQQVNQLGTQFTLGPTAQIMLASVLICLSVVLFFLLSLKQSTNPSAF
jgi:hypothetical protein